MSNKRVKKITDFNEVKKPVTKKKDTTPISQQTTAMDMFEVWFSANWKMATAVLGGIVLLICIGAIAWHINAANVKAVNMEIASATDIAGLENVIRKYKTNPATVPAMMKLAALYLGENNYAKAYDTLKMAVNSPEADIFLRTRAAIDCAGILELQGNTEDAVKELEVVAGNVSANESQRAEAACNAARILAAKGDKEKAILVLGNINLARATMDTTDPYALWAQKALDLKKRISAPVAAPAAAPVADKK